SVIALFTEGGTSPFFALHVFVILSVSVRWGLAATRVLTVRLALLYPGLVIGGQWFDFHESVFRSIHLFRPIYLLVIGYLIGYLGEHERRAKRKLAFMLELPAAFRRKRPPGRAFSRLVRRALDYFKAERGTLALRDPESGRYFVWDVARGGRRTRLSLRIAEDDPAPFRFAGPTEGVLANDLRPDGGTGSSRRLPGSICGSKPASSCSSAIHPASGTSSKSCMRPSTAATGRCGTT